jgi:hypothetical protein
MAGGALSVYNGMRRGGIAGYAGAALGANKFLTSSGTGYGSNNPYLGAAGNVLGIYNGIKQGGVSGYGGAAVNAASLAGAGGSYIPYVGGALAPLWEIAEDGRGGTGCGMVRGSGGRMRDGSSAMVRS